MLRNYNSPEDKGSPTNAKHIDSPEVRARYRILKIIGKGSQGTVYKARDRESGEYVAIKAVKHQAGSFYTAKRIFREIAILRHLSEQPGAEEFIAPLIDVVKHPGASEGEPPQYFIILKYIQGQTLSAFLDRTVSQESMLSQKEVKLLAHRLIRAVNFLHQAGVLHRDLKPANVMITPEMEVKIIDFGLARTISQKHSPITKLKTPKTKSERREFAEHLPGLLHEKQRKAKRAVSPHVYTRNYRPPEVCLMEKHYSFEADIWSMGCVLGEIMAALELQGQPGAPSSLRKLFLASSCFPLSPAPEEAYGESQDGAYEFDLIKVILRVLGDQRDSDLSYICDSHAYQYVVQNFSNESRVKFQHEFRQSDSLLTSSLQGCLSFNPYFRPSASELLHSFNLQAQDAVCLQENSKHGQINLRDPSKLDLEVDSPGNYDYENNYSGRFETADILSMIDAEISRVNKK